MAHLAAPAPQPGDEVLPAAARRPDMTPVPRPEHQPPGARRARRTGELHLPPGCHVRIDRQRARPYHGHRRHRLGSLPATVPKRRRGGIPHVPTETPKIMACAGTARQPHRQTAQPKTREGCSGSQAVNTSLAAIACRIESSLAREFGDEEFVTAIFAELSADGAKMELLNCGHPDPLLVGPAGPQFIGSGQESLPLGLGHLTGEPRSTLTIAFEPGDQVLFYTDGIAEARNRAGEFFPLA